MPFVAWHYRNGCYVRSHYRRPPWRDTDSNTLPLFAQAGLPGRPVRRGRRRSGRPDPATAMLRTG
jgi:hypothetical protein